MARGNKANREPFVSIQAETKEMLRYIEPAVQHMPRHERYNGYGSALKGVRLNEKKFYDQPATHGVEFLGSHIKPNRACLNSGTIETALMRVDEMNGWEDKEVRIEGFIASVNSYTGLTKNRTNHKATTAIRERISPGWWQYVEWNDARKCVNARPGYKHNEMLDKKYHLKLKYHDKRRNKGKAQ